MSCISESDGPFGSVEPAEWRALADDPPSRRAAEAAVKEVRTHLDSLDTVGATTALATGGSARALRKVVGPTLDRSQFDKAIRLAARKTSREITRDYGLHAERARVLLAEAIILGQIHDALGMPLEVANGGLCEGIACRSSSADRGILPADRFESDGSTAGIAAEAGSPPPAIDGLEPPPGTSERKR